jgi:uncharacterized protein
MIRYSLLSGVLALGIGFVGFARADEASHKAAVEKLFATMEMPITHQATIDKMLQTQMQANPAMTAMRGVLEPFLNKHLGWDALKDDMVKLYAQTFSEEEIGELEKFYLSPVGRKTLKEMPGLMAKGMATAQQKMQTHMPELQAALQEEAAKKGLDGGRKGGAPENLNK